MKKWTKEEETLLLTKLKQYKSVSELPLVSLAKDLGRTTSSIRKKATRLFEGMNNQYKWEPEERKMAFDLYTEGYSYAYILEQLHEYDSTVSLGDLEKELIRLRKVWSDIITKYAEERQLPVAKSFKLETIRFFMDNNNTDSDFIRKALHKRLKNG